MRASVAVMSTLIMILTLTMPCSASEYVAMTSPLPPYSINKGLHVEGIAVDTLAIMMTRTGSPMTPDDVQLMLWDHALKLARTGPKRIMLNMPKTAKTDPLFKWVGPYHVTRYVIVGYVGSPKIRTLDDLKGRKTATIRDSQPEKALLEAGVSKRSLSPSLTHVIPLKKLKRRMIDYFAHTDISATYMLRKMGMSLGDYTVIHTFREVELYYAFSRDTPDSFIAKLNATLTKLKKRSKNGKSQFDMIMGKYLPYGILD